MGLGVSGFTCWLTGFLARHSTIVPDPDPPICARRMLSDQSPCSNICHRSDDVAIASYPVTVMQSDWMAVLDKACKRL